MISSTTASTPPPPPPPVSTIVVRSRSTSSRSSAIGNSPSIALLLWRNERTVAKAVPSKEDAMNWKMMAIALMLLAGCAQQGNQQAKVANQMSPAAANENDSATTPNETGLISLPPERAPFPEPKGPID